MAATKKAETKKAAAVQVTATQDYYDLQLKVIKHVGDVYEVSSERAAELESLKLAKK